jgi:hypothetical protein
VVAGPKKDREVMAKKAPAKKAPAKRKPRAKKPDTLVFPITDPTDYGTPVEFPAWLTTGLKAVSLFVLGSLGGIWAAGGIDVSPSPLPADAVSAVYDTQESAFRRLSGERAKALQAGELTTEKASADWMAAKYLPESDAAWATLLTAEAAAFGGEQWTAEKEAAHVGRYAR